MEYELLDAKLQKQLQGDPVLGVFIKSNHVPMLEAGKHVTEMILGRFPIRRIEVSIRADVWFLYDSFPVWFPFSKPQQPPTWEEFRHSKEVQCNNVYYPLSCSYDTIPISPNLKDGQAPGDIH